MAQYKHLLIEAHSFIGLTASQGNGGETVFVDTVAIINELNELELAQLATVTAKYTTEKKAHYGGVIEVNILQYDQFLKSHMSLGNF